MIEAHFSSVTTTGEIEETSNDRCSLVVVLHETSGVETRKIIARNIFRKFSKIWLKKLAETWALLPESSGSDDILEAALLTYRREEWFQIRDSFPNVLENESTISENLDSIKSLESQERYTEAIRLAGSTLVYVYASFQAGQSFTFEMMLPQVQIQLALLYEKVGSRRKALYMWKAMESGWYFGSGLTEESSKRVSRLEADIGDTPEEQQRNQQLLKERFKKRLDEALAARLRRFRIEHEPGYIDDSAGILGFVPSSGAK